MLVGSVWRRVLLVFVGALIVLSLSAGKADEHSADRSLVLVAGITGPIGPATAHHVNTTLKTAHDRKADVLVFRINTPGGLATSMRDVINAVMAAEIPIIGYVSPSGAHAASAGTYILYAMPVAAMAPGTNLGAATPVQIGGIPSLPNQREKPDEQSNDDAEGADDGEVRPRPLSGADAMTAKATNDAVAFIRSLADVHGRNADWAEEAVREAASLSANEALEHDVINLVAYDLDELLSEIDGWDVKVGKATHTLSTHGANVEILEPGVLTKLLGVLSNPNLAFVLMMLGVYGIIFEFMNPGSLAPGVVGAISLVLGLFALNQLPLDYAGLALLMLGVAFMVAEAITPTFGILGFGGLVAFVIGSVMLIDTDVPAYQLSWWMIGVMAAVSGAVLIFLVGITWRSYSRATASTGELIAGAEGSVMDWAGDAGHVWAKGERWRARGPPDLQAGHAVRVTGVDGLTLLVSPFLNNSTAADDQERIP
ncbi:MAG: nodulation protein NfeD [Pseudomonadota bacterium]